MADLRLKSLIDDKPVKMQVELPASVHRDLEAYAAIMSGEGGDDIAPQRLVGPMLAKFMASDRGFKKAKRLNKPA
ncbi:MAG: DUF2274 domain-containing protein [Parasphingorhabdus sp.]|uniref:DUF2274 domain-containing protein n=1 Tax=Parasphingorhabdus sp. TaxID=2709688 RepID=UPI0030033D48